MAILLNYLKAIELRLKSQVILCQNPSSPQLCLAHSLVDMYRCICCNPDITEIKILFGHMLLPLVFLLILQLVIS